MGKTNFSILIIIIFINAGNVFTQERHVITVFTGYSKTYSDFFLTYKDRINYGIDYYYRFHNISIGSNILNGSSVLNNYGEFKHSHAIISLFTNYNILISKKFAIRPEIGFGYAFNKLKSKVYNYNLYTKAPNAYSKVSFCFNLSNFFNVCLFGRFDYSYLNNELTELNSLRKLKRLILGLSIEYKFRK